MYRNIEEYEKMRLYHKSRIFDPNSYYYYMIFKYPHTLDIDRNSLFDKNINKLFNSVLIHSEVERTKGYINQKGSLKEYLKGKRALQDNEDIVDKIISKKITDNGKRQVDLFEILGRT